MCYVDNTNIMSVFLPFTYKVGLNSQAPFPGAYILVGGSGANGMVPIYTSMPSFIGNTAFSEFLNDKDAQVILLPGYKIDLYPQTLYSGTVTSFDNRAGTDILYQNASLAASSCKLFYKFRTGFDEVKSNISFVDVAVTTNPSITPSNVLYNSINYNLYSFTTVGSTTFTITSTTDVSALVLLVAGGGAGGSPLGSYESAGGGGAGGVAIGTIHIAKNTQHTCLVGGGGATQAANGGDSTLTNNVNSQRVTVKGGGGGGGGGGVGKSGGSGGGTTSLNGWGFSNGSAQTATGNNIAGITNYYGGSGGTGWGTNGSHLGGGGGGGAGGNGGNAYGQYTQIGGGGGAGYTWPVNNVAYAGGGGGGSGANTVWWQVAYGGSGVGGNGGVHNIYDANGGAANRGGGGGGGQSYHGSSFGTGGSGIIIIAIPQFAVSS